MALAKGEDFELMDCTPRCKDPDCLGRVWFAVPLGTWQEKLLTKAGDDRLFAHGDWVFAERMRLRRAEAAKSPRHRSDEGSVTFLGRRSEAHIAGVPRCASGYAMG